MKRKTRDILLRIVHKVLLLFLIGGVCVVGSTNAYLIDTETSENNLHIASTLDFSLSPPPFSVTDLRPGNNHTGILRVQQEGAEAFTSKMWVVKTAGDSALCDTLQLDAQLSGISQYNGSLSAFSLNPSATLAAGFTEWTFIIRLDDTNYTLQSKICSFDIRVKGWQVESDGTWGFTDEESVSNIVATGRWQVPQVPVLLFPPNNSYINTTGLILDWGDVPVVDGPLTYTYQSAYDGGFSSVAYTSIPLTESYIPSPGNPEGAYWWHVQACNSNGCSEWSDTWKVTIDNTKPSSIISTGLNLNNDNESLKTHVHWTSVFDWNGFISGTASDNFGVSRVELSIHRPLLGTYWDGDSWESGTEAGTRVTASLTSPVWSYALGSHPTGLYVIKSHAVDFAGNMENTFTLYLDFVDAPPTAELSYSEDKKTVSFKIVNIKGFDKLDYTLQYVSYDSTKGIVGTDIRITDMEIYEKIGLDLATCSGGVCTYDENVKNFILNLTLRKNDGTIKELSATK